MNFIKRIYDLIYGLIFMEIVGFKLKKVPVRILAILVLTFIGFTNYFIVELFSIKVLGYDFHWVVRGLFLMMITLINYIFYSTSTKAKMKAPMEYMMLPEELKAGIKKLLKFIVVIDLITLALLIPL